MVVELSNGQKRRCHVDQIRKRTVGIASSPDFEMEDPLPNTPMLETTPESNPTDVGDGSSSSLSQSTEIESSGNDTESVTPLIPETQLPRPEKTPTKTYPKRNRRPVERYSPSKQT